MGMGTDFGMRLGLGLGTRIGVIGFRDGSRDRGWVSGLGLGPGNGIGVTRP